MKYRYIGNLKLSEIGLGCMGFSCGHEKVSEDYAIEAIHAAYRAGCIFFDTAEAPAGELWRKTFGENERLLGKAAAYMTAVPRYDYMLATKMNLTRDEVKTAGVYQAIREHLLASLERLDTDYLDLYSVQSFDPEIFIEEVAEAMGRLKEEDLLVGWGMPDIHVTIIERAHRTFPMSAVYGNYSMLERTLETEVIPYCLQNDIGVIALSPLNSELLSSRGISEALRIYMLNAENRLFDKAQAGEHRKFMTLLQEYADRKSATPGQIALAWVLHKHPHTVPLLDSKNKEDILLGLAAGKIALSGVELAALDSVVNGVGEF